MGNKSLFGAQQWMLLFVAGALAGPAWAATPASPAAAPALQPAHARQMDCAAMKESLLGKLDNLRTDEDQIEGSLCDQSRTTGAEKNIKNEFGVGSCVTTYLTINSYAKKILDQADKVCRIVEDAKALERDCQLGQAACLRAQSSKDRQAAAELRRAKTLLEDAKKALRARQDEIQKTASAYRAQLDDLRKLVEGARTDEEFNAIFSCHSFGLVFGDDYAKIEYYRSMGRERALAVLNGYDTGYDAAFPQAPENEEGDRPAHPHALAAARPPSDITGLPGPTDRLGGFTSEISTANQHALEALKTTGITMPRVQEYTTTFTQRAETLSQAADRLGEPDGGARDRSSTITEGRDVATALNAIASVKPQESRTPSLSGASSQKGAATSPTPEPSASSSKPSASARLDQSPRDSAEADAGTSPVASAKSGEKASEKGEDLLGSFGPLGAVQGGTEGPRATAPAAMPLEAGSAIPAAASRRSAPLPGDDAKTDIPEEARAAGGLPGAPKGAARAEAEPAERFKESTGLRDLLRKRLADRAKEGGDVNASVAADAVLEAARGGGRGPASEANGDRDGTEQAGLPPMDSEPLFSRVHHAHLRFERRHYPRRAASL